MHSDGGSRMRERQIDTESTEPPSLTSSRLRFLLALSEKL